MAYVIFSMEWSSDSTLSSENFNFIYPRTLIFVYSHLPEGERNEFSFLNLICILWE